MGSNCIKWTMLELKGLLEDEDARVTFQRSKKHLSLHPFQLNDLNRALRENLTSKVNFYDHDLQGLVLAYRHNKLLDSLAGILHDSHFIHVNIEADFYVFKPEIGCTLKGIANKKAGNHLGVLVHKAFNVSIVKDDDCQEWLGDYVYVGQQVKFTVTHLDFKGRLPFIRGELIADETMGQVYYDTISNKNTGNERVVEEEYPLKERKKISKKSCAVLTNGDDEIDSLLRNNELSTARKKNEKNKLIVEEKPCTSESKIKRKDSMEKKSKEHKKTVVDSESSSEDVDEKPNPKKIAINRTNGRNSVSDSEDSSDHEKIKKSILNTIVQTNAQTRSKNRTVDSESSDDDRSATNRGFDMNKSPNSPGKRKTYSSSVLRNKSSSIDSDTSTDEKPRKPTVSNKARVTNETLASPTKRSKTNLMEGSMSEIDVKPGPKVKGRKKEDEEKTNVEVDVRRKSAANSNAHRNEGIKMKSEKEEKAEEEDERKQKKSKVQVMDGRKLKKEEEEDEKKQKKSKVQAADGKKLKNEEEEEERKKKKSKRRETENGEEHREEESKKTKSKQMYKIEEEVARETTTSTSEFEFVKPDLDTFETPITKSKRKRRKTITEEEKKEEEEEEEEGKTNTVQTIEYSEEFFRDVRVKIEPDPSDIEDFRPNKKEKKRKRKMSGEENFVVKSDDIYENIEIKQELMSDVEDLKSSRKKSKKKSHEQSSGETVPQVKTERDVSEVNSPTKKRIKREPVDSPE
ncbi:DNA ligase 1 [Venturia canescens]|uniref:DNA ligase 1 n=1 Tax=Venturia canescens TaxID=32260 RepID=UPI001C9CDE6D|nr:DNA ligase 1 [Venturia canescens]